jgi:hypothetical protein
MKAHILRSVFMGLISATAMAPMAHAQYPGPAGGEMSPTAKQNLFSKYCVGQYDSTDIPQPNYNDADVRAAVKQMSSVADTSFFFYGPVLRVYGLGTKDGWADPPATALPGVSKGTHAFLVQLCAEFRDRPTMISEKVNWLKRLYKPQYVDQTPIDPSKNIWSQMTAKSYNVLLQFTSTLWSAKQSQLQAANQLQIQVGKYSVDMPVEPASVCETKYMLTTIGRPEYSGDEGQMKLQTDVLGTLSSNYSTFQVAYNQFAQVNCSQDDLNSVYDYRGDGNFKHNSPESNGMLWTVNSIASHCKDPAHARAGDQFVTDQDCQNYFRNPFRSRWATARAGLATWLFRDKKYDDVFGNPSAKVVVYQDLKGLSQPFAFGLPSQTADKLTDMIPTWLSNLSSYYVRGDMGFNDVVGLNTGAYDVNLAYERLRDAVNRHTNWYQSAFDDGMGYKMEQVYSPYVASSHVMAASNGFASGRDGRHAWMFIFKVKKSNIRDTSTVLKGMPVDFDMNWFDETSLGTDAGVFAKNERALDRLGTPIEGEFDSILYLHNVEGDDGLNGTTPPAATGAIVGTGLGE